MTLRQARATANYWITILQIPEWREKMEIVWGPKEMFSRNGEEFEGFNDFFAEGLNSRIYLRPKLSDKATEIVIIHELLHLVIDGHKPLDKITKRNYDPLHERALNRLAETLYLLDQMNRQES